jgi:hypothetical protein
MHQNAVNVRDDFYRITVDTLHSFIDITSKMNIADFWVFSGDEGLWNDKTALKYSYCEWN